MNKCITLILWVNWHFYPHVKFSDWTAVEVNFVLLILEWMISKCKNTVIINANCLYQANSYNKQGLVARIGQDDKPKHQKEMNTMESLGVAQADIMEKTPPLAQYQSPRITVQTVKAFS